MSNNRQLFAIRHHLRRSAQHKALDHIDEGNEIRVHTGKIEPPFPIHSSIKRKQRLGGIIQDIGNSLSHLVLAIIARDLRSMDEVTEITTTILYLQHQEVADTAL